MNAVVLALLISIFAVFLALYYFTAVVRAAAHVPQERSLLCAAAGARNVTAVNQTVGPCVYNGTYIIYLSPP